MATLSELATVRATCMQSRVSAAAMRSMWTGRKRDAIGASRQRRRIRPSEKVLPLSVAPVMTTARSGSCRFIRRGMIAVARIS